MEPVLMQRRRILLAISQIALATGLAACGQDGRQVSEAAVASGDDSDLELLASLAYEMLPFPALPPELYVQVGQQMLESATPGLNQSLAQVREATGAIPWKTLDEDHRVTILAGMQDSAFFASLRAATIEVLYRSPAVFAMLGYGGAAIEQGGYLNRGFDEIHWLPQE